MEPNIKTNVWKSGLLKIKRLFEISLLVTRKRNLYLLIYFYKLVPWGITNKKIQNECTVRSKSFTNFKMLDSFIIATELRHKEDGRLPCSSACKTKQGTMMSSCNSVSSVKGLKEHNSKADPYSHTHRSMLWQQIWAMVNGSPPTHASELTEGRGLPPGNNLSHPKLHRTHPTSSHGMAGGIFSMHS